MFLEPSGAVGKEQIEIRIEPDGKLAMYSNAGPSGQGLETVLPEVVSRVLGMPEDQIERRIGECRVGGDEDSPVGQHDALELMKACAEWRAICVAAHVAAPAGQS